MVTPLCLADEVVFALALDRGFAGAAVVVSITDDLVFLGEGGADFAALRGFGAFAAALVATGADFAGLTAGAFLATDAFFAGFDFAAVLLAFVAAGAFRDAEDFFAIDLDLTGTPAFFVADFAATGLALAFGLDSFALVFGFGFAFGFARAPALVDLAVDWVFFMIFAISMLTL